MLATLGCGYDAAVERCEPEIDYPTRWSYKVVCESLEALRADVTALMAGRDHTFEASRRSRTGRFVSVRIETTVTGHDDRRGLAASLQALPGVRFVL